MNPLSQLTEREKRDQRGRSARGRPTLGSALRDERFREDLGANALNALVGVPAGALGAPVDLMTMAMRPFGYSVPQEGVVGSSDWIGRKAGADPGNPAFIAGQFASPDAADAVKLAGLLDPNALMALGGMTAYHGTPHRFMPEPDAPLGKFNLDKIGTGEGAQAYGHGIYLAESPDVAGSYRAVLTGSGADGAKRQLAKANGDVDAAIAAAREKAQKYRAGGADSYAAVAEEDLRFLEMYKKDGDWPKGSLYTVDLPDEQIEKMLDWDKPLSEQPESVRKAIDKLGFGRLELSTQDRQTGKLRGMTGQEFYKRISGDVGGDAAATARLNELGIPGIRYLDGTSRKAGEGTRNFVLFDPEIAKITSVE